VTVISGSNPTPAPQETTDPTDATTLTGGAIAGIVIGSIAGLLLLIWIIRSCTNLGAPPGSEERPGRPWYGGVRDEYPARHTSRSRSRHSHHHHHSSRHHHRDGRRSRRASVVAVEQPVQVAEVSPVVVRESRRSTSRGPSPQGYYGYGDGGVRGSRSRSRGRY
jgi:hypothetical protein